MEGVQPKDITAVTKIVTQPTKEQTGFRPPWETIRHEADEYGFSRTEYKFTPPISDHPASVIFVNPRDTFIQPTADTAIIPKGVSGIIDHIQRTIGTDIPDYLVSESVIWPAQKRDIMESMAAASVYDADGKIKYRDDNEGSALLFGWLSYQKTNPEISSACFEELMNRRVFIKANTAEVPKDTSALRLGEIPYQDIIATHVTDFLPFISDDGVRILPLFDTEKAARWTVHTYINGVVEEHAMSGFNKQSWENRKYLVGMNFRDVAAANGLPANFFKADTFWSLEPGQGLIVPEGTFIVVPKSEVPNMEPYRHSGINIVEYDPGQESLRAATKRYFDEHNLPFIEHIDPKDADQADELFAQSLGLKALSHDHYRKYSDSETDLMYAERVLKKGKEFTEDGKGRLTWEEAEQISMLAPQSVMSQYRPKKTALANTIQFVRDAILEAYKDKKMPKEALMTAYALDLL